MRVGLIDDVLWAHVESNGARTGVEVLLVERLAHELDADLKWDYRGDARLMPALEQFELDLVIGGTTEDTA